jgi:hypothetical protein
MYSKTVLYGPFEEEAPTKFNKLVTVVESYPLGGVPT